MALKRGTKIYKCGQPDDGLCIGFNPLGKTMTGLRFSRVHNPHDRESAYTKSRAGGLVPVFYFVQAGNEW